jgi:hypothetical protein
MPRVVEAQTRSILLWLCLTLVLWSAWQWAGHWPAWQSREAMAALRNVALFLFLGITLRSHPPQDPSLRWHAARLIPMIGLIGVWIWTFLHR